MTSLETIMKENDISKYSVLKHLGKDPSSVFQFVSNKLAGKNKILYSELSDICDFISDRLEREITPEDLSWDPIWVKLK